MGRTRSFIIGTTLGIGAMYLLDPDRGRRRRALARDQLISALHTAGEATEGRQKDLRNRARGVVAETAARVREREVDDVVLVERVRSAMGRLVGHAGAVDVSARDGTITLRGPVPRHELGPLVTGVAEVRGVQAVDNQLDVFDEPAG